VYTISPASGIFANTTKDCKGKGGNISIDTPTTVIQNGGEIVETLPNTPIDVSKVLEQRCLGSTIASNKKESQFIKTGRGGLPSNPNNPITSEVILSPPWITVDSSSASGATEAPTRNQTSPTPTSSPQKTVEATGWRRNTYGDIELIAVGTTMNPEPVSNSCSGVR